MVNELIQVANDLDCKWLNTDEYFMIKFKNFKSKFKIIAKQKAHWILVLKIKDEKCEGRMRFYNLEKLKSYICCQFILECFQNA